MWCEANSSPDAIIEAGIVRHEVRRAVHVGDDRRTNVRVVDVRNVERTGATAALDQRDDLLLRRDLARQALLLEAADKGFVALDNLAFAAERIVRVVRFVHCLADAVAEEPSGFVGDAQHALHLLGAHALFGRGHEVRCEEPLVKRNVRTLHNRAGSHGELLATHIAKEHASLGLAAHAGDARALAVRAHRLTVRPAVVL